MWEDKIERQGTGMNKNILCIVCMVCVWVTQHMHLSDSNCTRKDPALY